MLKEPSQKKMVVGVLLLSVLAMFFLYETYISPPVDFNSSKIVRVEDGETLAHVALKLEEQNIIRSRQWFSNFVIYLKGEGNVIAGDYLFSSPENSFTVAKRITGGEFGFEPIKITIPEGLMAWEVGQIFGNSLPKFDEDRFISLAEEEEGYLFPDTYFFLPTADEGVVISRMTDQFDRATARVSVEIGKFGRPLEEVVIMASILEEEATTSNDRKIIAGILWERIRIGMPLQVDAVFLIINGKKTNELTREDLEIDSPYNTYKYLGLPPGPISSPGLDSIVAAVNPTHTSFLYYLSEDDGTMHYAETLEEHNENKRKFLLN